MLIIVMIAMLCGLDQLHDIVVFANERADFFKEHFGIEKIPSKPTLSRMLSMIKAESVSKVIIEIMKDEVKELGEIVSFDGKAIRSTSEKGKPHSALQILTAYMVESGVVLAQESIHEKTNEIPVMRDILEEIDIRDKIVTADAMHCQRETCAKITDDAHGGDYVIGLKENQKTLHDDVALFFNDAINGDSIETHSEAESNGGRLERRICRSTDEVGFLSEHNWPGLKSIFEVRRIISNKNGTLKSDETSYYISSLEAPSVELLRISRAHWGIESMHWMLDCDFSEDECGLLSDNAQEVFNVLRKLALLLHKRYMAKQQKKRSIKSNLLRCLVSENAVLEIFRGL
jgi:predicted transposase YbfD/YdcC